MAIRDGLVIASQNMEVVVDQDVIIIVVNTSTLTRLLPINLGITM